VIAAIPCHRDDLGAILERAFALMAQGAVDRRSPLHTPTVATVEDSTPHLRSVVLRGFSAERRSLAFHTDARSPKFAALKAWPLVAMHFYHPAEKVQLRISGAATLHHGDEVARLAWERSTPSAQLCYQVQAGPGQIIEAPDDVLPASVEVGMAAFARVEIPIARLEYLYLQAGGHRRARFTWADGTLSSVWIAP
jgi:hypothetical protein